MVTSRAVLFTAAWLASLATFASRDARADAIDDAVASRCVLEPRLAGAARVGLARGEQLDGASLRDQAERDGLPAPSVHAWSGRGADAVAVAPLALAWLERQAPTAWSRCAVAHAQDRWTIALVPRVASVDGAHGALAAPGSFDVAAELPRGARSPLLVVLRPDGSTGRMPAPEWPRWTVAFDQPGAYALQLLADTTQGPLPFATWHVTVPGRSAPVASRAAAPAPEDAPGVLVWINRQRVVAGVEPLRADPLLASLARARANELALHGTVAHALEPGDGPVARLGSAHLGADRLAENVARARSVAEACARLDSSPSHHANRVDPTLDAAGIGVAEAAPGSIYVVELFATHPRIAAE